MESRNACLYALALTLSWSQSRAFGFFSCIAAGRDPMYIKAFIRYLLSLGLILPALAFISAPAVAAADCSGPNDVTVVIEWDIW